MRSPWCLCVCKDFCLWTPPLINFWMPEPTFMKLCTYVYNGTWAHLSGVLHKSLPSVCLSLCISVLSLLGKSWVKCIPAFIAGQRLGKQVPAAKSTHNNKRNVWCACLWVCLCIFLWLPGKNSVQTFPRQKKIIRGVISYATRVT
jgi:hypothetical protein